jgi:hypothetical protein
MRLGAASRHLVGGKGWLLRMLAKNVGVSITIVAQTPETVKAKRGCGDHYFTVVSQAMAYYRCVVSDRKMRNGMNSRSVYVANSYKS